MKSFYFPPEAWPSAPGQVCQLGGSEAHHLLKVLRAKEGEQVRLFDGCGNEGLFRLTEGSKSKAWLTAEELTHHPAPNAKVILAIGWAKALRRSWLLEKAVELEATEIWLWQARHSQGKLPEEIKETWQGQLIAGAKQCGNPWLPVLRTFPKGLDSLLEASQDLQARFLLWEDQQQQRLLTDHDLGAASTLYLLGPEGGFSQDEVDAALAGGLVAVSLGKRILRWETAALLCLGLSWWARGLGSP